MATVHIDPASLRAGGAGSHQSRPSESKRQAASDTSILAREVLRLRLAQLLVNEAYKDGRFSIPIHLALGHEALAVACAAAADATDFMALSHRNIHYNLARNGSLRSIWDEYLLREAGAGSGRLGSMNLANRPAGILYTSSILGNNLGVAAGLAMAERVLDTGGVPFVVTGDGAIEEGTFYETLMFLMSHRLACVLVVENNEWSLATRVDERRCRIDLPRLCASMRVPHVSLQGNDVVEYHNDVGQAREQAAVERSPVCVEARLHTLGFRWVPSEAHPGGRRYVNYHAGPAAEVVLCDWPLLMATDDDPLHVLCRRFDEPWLRAAADGILASLKDEIA